ncbi:MAG: hypothetical protein OZ948_00430 [Deltaproteobacteria bacterium]|nr:hypothetical protein [Deltaproteobacteria bacterium]
MSDPEMRRLRRMAESIGRFRGRARTAAAYQALGQAIETGASRATVLAALRALGEEMAAELGRLHAQGDDRAARERLALEVLGSEATDRQKLQRVQRAMGWQRPRKRDPRELIAAYRALTQGQGIVRLAIESGPRAPLEVGVPGCPLAPGAAIARLRELYAANSESALLAALHAARDHDPTPRKPLPPRAR